MKQWLKVVDNNGTVKEQFEVYVHDGLYTVFTPRQCKHYKTLKAAQKFLSTYKLTIA